MLMWWKLWFIYSFCAQRPKGSWLHRYGERKHNEWNDCICPKSAHDEACNICVRNPFL